MVTEESVPLRDSSGFGLKESVLVAAFGSQKFFLRVEENTTSFACGGGIRFLVKGVSVVCSARGLKKKKKRIFCLSLHCTHE